jgi:hypothetical protein
MGADVGVRRSYKEPELNSIRPRDAGKEKNKAIEKINEQPYFSVKSFLIWPFNKW